MVKLKHIFNHIDTKLVYFSGLKFRHVTLAHLITWKICVAELGISALFQDLREILGAN